MPGAHPQTAGGSGQMLYNKKSPMRNHQGVINIWSHNNKELRLGSADVGDRSQIGGDQKSDYLAQGSTITCTKTDF